MGFSISRMRLIIVLKLGSIGVISSQKSIALIKIWKKWPLGGQNGDFILSKLNNRLVNHRVTRNSIFLLHFWKVRGIWILNQSKKVTAGVRYYGLQLLENCLLFSTSRMRSLRFLKLLYGGVILPEKSIARIRIEKKWPLGGQNRYILKIASLFQAAANHSSGHQRSLFLTDLESKFHELFKNAIKRLNFEWHGG